MKIDRIVIDNGDSNIAVWRDTDSDSVMYGMQQPECDGWFYITEAAAQELARAIAILREQA